MLWDLIRDFFVQHIFGGTMSDGSMFGGMVGSFYDKSFNGMFFNGNTAEIMLPIGDVVNGDYDAIGNIISLGDWLSTTATIITITIITIMCCLFVYKIIKLIGGLIR